MKRKLFLCVLAMVFAIGAGGALKHLIPASAEETGDRYKFVRTDSLKGPNAPSAREGTMQIYNDMPGSSGSNNPIVLLNSQAWVEYPFDLADDISNARLSVCAQRGYVKVEVKADGSDAYQALTAVSDADKGYCIYLLSQENALSAANNKFTVRITNALDGGEMVLSSIAVQAEPPMNVTAADIGEELAINPYTDNEGKYFYSSTTGINRYWLTPELGATQVPSAHSVVFRLVFADDVHKVLVSHTSHYGNLTLETSANGSDYAAPEDGTVDVSEEKTLYIRLTAYGAEDFIKTLTVRNIPDEAPVPGKGVNANTSVPEEEESFFHAGDEIEKAHMFATSENIEEEFNSTHSGLGVDGFEGGGMELGNNARSLAAGDYLVYDFDLPDDKESARLVLRAISGLNFSVSKDNGESWTELTAAGAPEAQTRGFWLFNLDKDNALGGEGNRFRLRIQAASQGYVFSVGVFAGGYEAENGAALNYDTATAYRHLYATNGSRSYYGNYTVSQFFLNSGDAYITFRFDLPATVGELNAKILISACGGGEALYVSADNESWSGDLIPVKAGGSSTPPTTFVSLGGEQTVKDSQTLYVKVSGTGSAGAFIRDLLVAYSTAEDEKEGNIRVGSTEDAAHFHSIDEASGVVFMSEEKDWRTPYRKVANGHSVTYRLDLNDDAYGMLVSVKAISGNYTLAVSSDPEANFTVVASGTSGSENAVTIYRGFERNPNKVVYLRITANDSDLVYSDISFTTEGVPEVGNTDKPYEDGDFDYDEEVPDISGDERPSLPAVPEDPDPVVVGGGATGGCGGSIAGAFAGWIILTGAALMLKKKSE